MSTQPILSIVHADGLSETTDETPRGGCLFLVDFHRSGNSTSYRQHGWSGQEDTHVWSLEGSSTLRLPPVLESAPLVADLDFDIGQLHSWVTHALLRVFANDVLVGAACAAGRSRLQCLIPADVIRVGSPIELRFEHPCYARVDFMDLSSDDRILGLCFYYVAVYSQSLLPFADNLLPHPEGQQLLKPLPDMQLVPYNLSAAAAYGFSGDGANRLPLGEEWRCDESCNAWATARECPVDVPAPVRPGHYAARFYVVPLRIRTVLASQRITILLNGAVVGQFQTGTDTLLTVPLPPELIEWGGTLRFGFLLPDGAPIHEIDPRQPRHFLSFILDSIEIEPLSTVNGPLAHSRFDDVASATVIALSDRFLDESVDELPAAVHDKLGIKLPEIMRVFESLGDNCAFGLAQRKADADVLGLLRFATSPLKNLMGALRDEFRAITDTSRISIHWIPGAPGEFILRTDDYGIQWHTNVCDSSVDQPKLFADQWMRLSYLRRKFYEGLKAGRKIYTITRAKPVRHPIPMPSADEPNYWEEDPEPLRFAELRALFSLLNRYGNNTLLYLVPAGNKRRAGTVELLAPGVMRGYFDNFVITSDPNINDHAGRLRVAVNAWLLDKGPNAAFRKR